MFKNLFTTLINIYAAITDARAAIGIHFSESFTDQEAHGCIKMQYPGGNVVKMNFKVSTTGFLGDPNLLHVNAIAHEASLMGYFPLYVEFYTEKTIVVYKFGDIKSLFTQQRV